MLIWEIIKNVSTIYSIFFLLLYRKKTSPVDSMVFACVSMTARAVGHKIAAKDSIFMEIISQMLGGVELRYVHFDYGIS